MARSKKTRRLKGKLDVKTGSKKSFINQGEMGKIPSKNKLAKHKNRQKSAYQKYVETMDTSADNNVQEPADETSVETEEEDK